MSQESKDSVQTAEKGALPFACCSHCGCPPNGYAGHDDTCRLCQCSCGIERPASGAS